MNDIINAFDGIYNAYLKMHRVEKELESEFETILDFNQRDIERLINLIHLKQAEVDDFYENGYLSDEQYNISVSSLSHMEDRLDEINP